jgi:hypothetical protein
MLRRGDYGTPDRGIFVTDKAYIAIPRIITSIARNGGAPQVCISYHA